MKKAIVLMLLFFLIQGCATYRSYDINADKSKKFPPSKELKVAVLPLNAPTAGTKMYSATVGQGTYNTPENAGKAVADAINYALIKVPNVVLIERSQLEKILSEHQLSLSGIIKNPDFNLLGKILPVDALVIGDVTSFYQWHDSTGYGGIVAFSARLVDIHSGEMLFTINCNALSRRIIEDQMANDLARDAIKKLLEK